MKVAIGIVIFLLWVTITGMANWRVEQRKCQETGHIWHRPWALRWYGCMLRTGRARFSTESSGSFWGSNDPSDAMCLTYRECTNEGAFPTGGWSTDDYVHIPCHED